MVVSEQQGVPQGHLGVASKVLLQQLTDVLQYEAAVFVGRQTVVEYPQALVAPHADKLGRGIESLRDGEREPVVDAREVPKVEDVVELGGCRREVAHDALVEIHGGRGDGLGEVLDGWGGREMKI